MFSIGAAMKTLAIILAGLLCATSAHAGDPYTGPWKTTKNLPDDMYGEWCNASYDDELKSLFATLPSWGGPGSCDDQKKIITINPNGYCFDGVCVVAASKVQTRLECAPSGCATVAKFTAKFTTYQEDKEAAHRYGPVEISRYKGNLTMKVR